MSLPAVVFPRAGFRPTALPRNEGRRAGIGLRLAIACLALLGSVSCTSFSLRSPLARFQGQMLRTSEVGGIDCLNALKANVEPVKLWMIRDGEPDYVLVESRREIYLFYLDRDQLVQFRKPLFGGRLQGTARQTIRSDHYTRFASSDLDRLLRARVGKPPPAEPRREEVLRRRVGEAGNGSMQPPGDRPQ
jgi:hypothetical protein